MTVMLSGQFDAISTTVLMPTDGQDQNPAFRPFANNWYTAIPAMALYDWEMIRLANRIGKRHPRMRAIILGTLAADHIAGGVHNVRNNAGFDGL